MKKIVLLSALLLVLGCFFVGCKDKDKTKAPDEIEFADLFNPTKTEQDVFTIAPGKEIEGLTNCVLTNTFDGFAEFTAEEAGEGKIKYAVFNSETNSVVYKLTYEAEGARTTTSAGLVSYGDITFIMETKKTAVDADDSVEWTYTLYDANGKSLMSKGKTAFVISVLPNDLLLIDGKVYATKDDTLTALFDLGMKEIPTCSILTDTYNYARDGHIMYVYDQNFDLVTYVAADSNADDTAFYVLNDGNILMVSMYQLLDEAEEYQFACGIEKFNITNTIFNIETQKSTAVKPDFVIGEVMNAYADGDEFGEMFLDGAIENFAVIYPIVNKTVDFSDIAADIVNLDNSAAILGALGEVIPNQGNNFPVLVADNRFVVSNVAGQYFLIDETGDVLGEISGDRSGEYGNIFDNMFVDTADNVYDLDLKKVFNLEDTKYTQYSGSVYVADDRCYMLTKTGYVPMNISTLELNGIEAVGDAVRCTVRKESATGEYENFEYFFNEKGTVIFSRQLDRKDTENGYTYVSIDNVTIVGDDIVITVATYSYDYTTYEGTTTYNTFFCSDNVPA